MYIVLHEADHVPHSLLHILGMPVVMIRLPWNLHGEDEIAAILVQPERDAIGAADDDGLVGGMFRPGPRMTATC